MFCANYIAPMTAYGLIQFLKSGVSVLLRKAENYKLSRQWILPESDCPVAFILAHLSLLLSSGIYLKTSSSVGKLAFRQKLTCWPWHWCTKNLGTPRACGSVPGAKCSLCLAMQVVKRLSVYVPASCRVFFSGLNATNKTLSLTYCEHTHSVLQMMGDD